MLDGHTEAMNAPQQNDLLCEVLADGSMMRWNHGWFKLVSSCSPTASVPVEKMMGSDFMQWVHEEDHSHVSEVLDLSDADDRPRSIQFRLAGETSERVFMVWYRVCDPQGNASIIGLGHSVPCDFTRNAEQEASSPVSITSSENVAKDDNKNGQYLLDSAELASFAGRANHDLRAPLRAISGLSQILVEDHKDQLDENGVDYLQRIAAAAKRVANTVDGVTDYLRLAGYGCSFQNVDLNQSVDEIVEFHGSHEAGWRGEVLSETLPLVHGDPAQLRTLLQELVGNGICHNDAANPSVRLVVDPIGLRDALQYSSSRVVIGVVDNGVGVDEQYRNDIFSAFRKLSPIGEESGLGLGLAIALRIVRRHGGDLRCYGHEDGGSCFVFDLPVAVKE